MPSLRSQLFIFALKNRHLLQFKSKQFKSKRRNTVGPDTPVALLREEVEKGADFFGKLPPEFEIVPVDAEGVTGEWLRPSSAPKDKAILYFHGGGLVIGSARSHRGIVSKFVKGSGIAALVFDYALAPEHPYPQALNDSLIVYRHMLAAGIAPSDIVFMGDSGGGNLVFTTMLALKEQGVPLPAAAVAMSPWTDLTNSGASYQTNARVDSLTWRDSQDTFSKYYCGEHDPKSPLISPLFGDLRGLPPLLIFVGNDELMRDDSTRFADKARTDGVDVTLRVGKGMFHCYPACAPIFPEATQAMDEISTFVKRHLS